MRKVLLILLLGSNAMATDFTGVWLFSGVQCYRPAIVMFPGSSFSTTSKCYLPDFCDTWDYSNTNICDNWDNHRVPPRCLHYPLPICLHYTPQYVPSYQDAGPTWFTPFGGYTESITISSGSFTNHITMNGCVVDITGSFASSPTNLTFSSRRVSSATLGSCPVDRGRTGTSGILPSKTETWYSNGDNLQTLDREYILRTGPDKFEIRYDDYSTQFQYKECTTGTPVIKKDTCYWVYTKQ